MTKKYVVVLNGERIGTTELEKADAPMGVVFGLIAFDEIASPYEFFRDYCKRNDVVLNSDEPENELIDTQDIKSLSVLNEYGKEIKGEATSINGLKGEGYYVEIIGIAYPFYGEEFPHHVEAYDNQFK
jgi:hypothetical protein